jgi:hypothetical protein
MAMSKNGYTYVFVDESGDSGFKLDKGSTQVFCIAAVIFRSKEDIETTNQIMQALKEQLGLKKTHEFHFHNEPVKFRKAFCEAVCGCPFVVRATVVDKMRIYEDTLLRKSPAYFYNFIIKMLLKHSFGAITNAKVCIDGSMNRELKTYLRQELNRESYIIHDIQFLDSRKSSMIQLADMIAGSIARSYRPDKRDSQALRRVLKPRIQDIWDFGKKI